MPGLVKLATDLDTAKSTVPVFPGRGDLSGSERFRAARPVVLNIHRDDDGTGTVAVYGSDLVNPETAKPSVDLAQLLVGDSSAAVAARTAITTLIPYVAFANYNWIAQVLRSGKVLEQGATLGFAITDDSDSAKITFAQETDEGDGSTVAFVLASEFALLDDFDLYIEVAGAEETDWVAADDGNGAIQVTFDDAPAGSAAIAYKLLPKNGVKIGLWYKAVTEILADAAHVNEVTGVTAKTAMWVKATGGTVDKTDVFLTPAV